MLRYSGGHGTAESRKDRVVKGWGKLSKQTRVKTGWGIGYDGDQGARQKTRLTARWRERQVEIKPNVMMGAKREREREGGGGRVGQMAGRCRDREKGRVIGRAGRKLRLDEWISRGLGEGQGKGQNRG